MKISIRVRKYLQRAFDAGITKGELAEKLNITVNNLDHLLMSDPDTVDRRVLEKVMTFLIDATYATKEELPGGFLELDRRNSGDC